MDRAAVVATKDEPFQGADVEHTADASVAAALHGQTLADDTASRQPCVVQRGEASTGGHLRGGLPAGGGDLADPVVQLPQHLARDLDPLDRPAQVCGQARGGRVEPALRRRGANSPTN